MSIKLKDIYWIAGILEGEGSFSNESNSPRIRLKMTDRDIVNRARLILNSDVEIKTIPETYPNKETYYITITGNIAVQWMYTLYPILGIRRRLRIKGIVESWKNSTQRVSGSNRCAKGHRLEEYGRDYYIIIGRSGTASKQCKQCQKISSALRRSRNRTRVA